MSHIITNSHFWCMALSLLLVAAVLIGLAIWADDWRRR